MVSSPDFANSLTFRNAASAHYTLVVMTVIALIVLAGRPALPGLDVLRLPARVTGEDVELPEPSRRRRAVAGRLTVRMLDQRLVRRARPVRRLLVLDTAVGIASRGARPAPGDR